MTRSLILAVVARYASPVLFAFAVLLFLKGHNAPGGGFIAGLLTAVALILSVLAFGREASRRRAAVFTRTIAVGLCIAVVTATVPAILGYAFFTHTFEHVHLPLLGDMELASAALFDLGVYVVVVGNVLTVILAITDDR